MTCVHCGEIIKPGERARQIVNADYHIECAFRCGAGSVGHILKRCSCYGGNEEDPPGMTKREAARAALELYRRLEVVKN